MKRWKRNILSVAEQVCRLGNFSYQLITQGAFQNRFQAEIPNECKTETNLVLAILKTLQYGGHYAPPLTVLFLVAIIEEAQ